MERYCFTFLGSIGYFRSVIVIFINGRSSPGLKTTQDSFLHWHNNHTLHNTANVIKQQENNPTLFISPFFCRCCVGGVVNVHCFCVTWTARTSGPTFHRHRLGERPYIAIGGLSVSFMVQVSMMNNCLAPFPKFGAFSRCSASRTPFELINNHKHLLRCRKRKFACPLTPLEYRHGAIAISSSHWATTTTWKRRPR